MCTPVSLLHHRPHLITVFYLPCSNTTASGATDYLFSIGKKHDRRYDTLMTTSTNVGIGNHITRRYLGPVHPGLSIEPTSHYISLCSVILDYFEHHLALNVTVSNSSWVISDLNTSMAPSTISFSSGRRVLRRAQLST
ncbi:hypothetical protein BDN67DRAFT_702484 [Paxillus ammoniavirescens]|nr:hypothetical protein BDN67DRAFT_702484 [Paxillus ammoniavirescens]